MLLRTVLALIACATCSLGCQCGPAPLGADGGPSADASVTTVDAGLRDAGPRNHRAMTDHCPTTRAPGTAQPGGSFGCVADSECDAGVNGRCEQRATGVVVNVCSYDQCFSDSDCGAKVPCLCRSALNANLCVISSTCQIDTDCGAGGLCSKSPYSLEGSEVLCSNGFIEGFHCRAANDLCHEDTDCSDGGISEPRCAFNEIENRWGCSKVCLSL